MEIFYEEIKEQQNDIKAIKEMKYIEAQNEERQQISTSIHKP